MLFSQIHHVICFFWIIIFFFFCIFELFGLKIIDLFLGTDFNKKKKKGCVFFFFISFLFHIFLERHQRNQRYQWLALQWHVWTVIIVYTSVVCLCSVFTFIENIWKWIGAFSWSFAHFSILLRCLFGWMWWSYRVFSHLYWHLLNSLFHASFVNWLEKLKFQRKCFILNLFLSHYRHKRFKILTLSHVISARSSIDPPISLKFPLYLF